LRHYIITPHLRHVQAVYIILYIILCARALQFFHRTFVHLRAYGVYASVTYLRLKYEFCYIIERYNFKYYIYIYARNSLYTILLCHRRTHNKKQRFYRLLCKSSWKILNILYFKTRIIWHPSHSPSFPTNAEWTVLWKP